MSVDSSSAMSRRPGQAFLRRFGMIVWRAGEAVDGDGGRNDLTNIARYVARRRCRDDIEPGGRADVVMTAGQT